VFGKHPFSEQVIASAHRIVIPRECYLQPAGVIVLPGGHPGFAGGEGGLAAAGAGAAGRGGGGDGLTAAVAGVGGRDGEFGVAALGGGVAASGFASGFDVLGGFPVFSFAWPLGDSPLSDLPEPGLVDPAGFVAVELVFGSLATAGCGFLCAP
jgi:hypothetical protein